MLPLQSDIAIIKPLIRNHRRMDNATYTYRLLHLSTGYRNATKQKLLASDMNADLRTGELTCLIGVNGAGKSTLLRTMASLQKPLDGSIQLMGRRLEDYGVKELSREVSVVLTDEVPEQNLSVEDTVALGRIPYTGYFGGLSTQDRRHINEAIEMVGMSAFRGRRLYSLSDGERQKVMIAKALAQDTRVILLDEPVAFLDFPSKVGMLRMLGHVAKERNKSVLLSIHDISLALQMAQRLWILRERSFIEGEPRYLAEEGKIDFLFSGEGIRFNRETLQYTISNN